MALRTKSLEIFFILNNIKQCICIPVIIKGENKLLLCLGIPAGKRRPYPQQVSLYPSFQQNF